MSNFKFEEAVKSFKRVSEIEKMSENQRRDYFDNLFNICKSTRSWNHKITATQKLIFKLCPLLRHYPFEVRGEDKIPRDGCIILCNHSNEHDAFSIEEALTKVGLPCTFLAETYHISPISRKLFEKANATMIDRTDKRSTQNGMCDLANKIINSDTGVVFGESTWNLHPVKPMQNLKIGAAIISAISKKPVVPTIIEYIEQVGFVSKESKLYKKCIVSFLEPVQVVSSRSIVEQNTYLQTTMEQERKKMWQENEVKKASLEDINPELYINHTALKIFSKLADVDYNVESSHLFSRENEAAEFTYTINNNGDFLPGEITRDLFDRVTQKNL